MAGLLEPHTRDNPIMVISRDKGLHFADWMLHLALRTYPPPADIASGGKYVVHVYASDSKRLGPTDGTWRNLYVCSLACNFRVHLDVHVVDIDEGDMTLGGLVDRLGQLYQKLKDEREAQRATREY